MDIFVGPDIQHWTIN